MPREDGKRMEDGHALTPAERAGQDGTKRFHFVITVERLQNLKPAMSDPNYDSWFAQAAALNCKSLHNKQYSELRNEIREIASRIVELRTGVVAELLR